MNADQLVRPGQRIGKYILGEPIARGGMAEVWSARVEGPEGFVKPVALKFVLESFRGDSELERLFVNEARVAAQLQHANLVSVFDFDKIADGEDAVGGRYYIAMERVDGYDLRRVGLDAHRRGQRLPPSVMLYIAGEVLKGLRHVHERRNPVTHRPLGLVHRDVSPHNILIGMGGEVKLSDFGIAKAMAQSFGTQSGLIRGKLAYASPEQLRNEPLDHRTDQFALGVTLWEGLAGRRLFDGTDAREIISKVNDAEVPLLSREVGVEARVEALVRRMLAAEAKARFPSTAEALSAVLAAPGYTPDGAPLAALMGELFAPSPRDVPATLRLPGPPDRGGGAARLSVGLAATGLAETKTLDREADLRPGPGLAAQYNAPTPAPSEIPTVNDRAQGRNSLGNRRRSGRTSSGAHEKAGRGDALVRARSSGSLSSTGSSYVSGGFPGNAVRPAGAMVVMGVVAVALLGTIGFVAWRTRRNEPAVTGSPALVSRPTPVPAAIDLSHREARRLPESGQQPGRGAELQSEEKVGGQTVGGELGGSAGDIESPRPDEIFNEVKWRRTARRDSVVRLLEHGPGKGVTAPAPIPSTVPPAPEVVAPEKANGGTSVVPSLTPNGAPVLQ